MMEFHSLICQLVICDLAEQRDSLDYNLHQLAGNLILRTPGNLKMELYILLIMGFLHLDLPAHLRLQLHQFPAVLISRVGSCQGSDIRFQHQPYF